MMGERPLVAGCDAPYLDVNTTSEFVCLSCCPIWEVIRIIDHSRVMLLDGHGMALPRGAVPCWLTE